MSSPTISPMEIVNARRVIGGQDDMYRGLSPRKYPWTTPWIETSMANHWTWTEPNLTRDISQYKTLPDNIRKGHDNALAFLSNLDSIQLGNLSVNILPYLSCYEHRECVNRQVWEEEIHVRSYSTLIETICDDPMDIYDRYRHNETLRKKNEFILSQSNLLMADGFSSKKFATACVANVVLEGIYFYSGFLYMYAIARSQRKMFGEREMIAYINRDEENHLELFANVSEDVKNENPECRSKEVEDSCLEVVERGTILETQWGQELIGDGMMGLTPEGIDHYIKYLANKRCVRLKLPKMYDAKYDKNPYPWVDQYSTPGEANFFESKPRTYQESGALEW